MDEKPKSIREPLLTPLGVSLIAVISIGSSVFALLLFGHYYQVHMNPIEGRSIVFASFAVNSMIYIFAYRSMRLPLHRMNRLTANKPLMWSVLAGLLTALLAFWIPGLRELLGIVPLSLEEWNWIIDVALVLLATVEAAKAIANRLHAND